MSSMSLRSRIVVPAVVLTAALALLAWVSIDQTAGRLMRGQESAAADVSEAVLSEASHLAVDGFQMLIDAASRQALEAASTFAKAPDVLDAYAIAHRGDLNDEADPELQAARQHLRVTLAPYVSGHDIYSGAEPLKLHFHTPTARSLSRLWQKDFQVRRDGQKLDVSDDLKAFRPSVIEINQGTHRPISGIEVGRGGFEIRGLAPVATPDGQHLGSVEALYPFNPVLSDLVKLTGGQCAVYMNHDLLDIASSLQDPTAHPVIEGRFVEVSSTDPETTRSLVSAAMLEKALTDTQRQEVDGQRYLFAFAIKDYSHEPVGAVVLHQDLSANLGPFKRMQDQARRIRAGIRLTSIVVGLLLTALVSTLVMTAASRLTTRIQSISVQLQSSASQTSEAADRVAASSEEIASGAGQQAASLLETSESAASVAQAVKHHAEGAQRAAELAGRTTTEATQGLAAMSRMVEAIDEIKRGADETAGVVKTIEEIALQTNLLALNAAVEAARAGEAGRGFSIVAEEVRNLAQRSRNAVQQTADLLNASTASSDRGVTISREVAEALSRINDASAALSALVHELSDRSQSQASGIDEISSAVSQMQSTTQSNASSAEISADSARNLRDQAVNLDALVQELSSLVAGKEV